MKFEIELNNPTIFNAAALVMNHYKDQAFLDMICNVEKFNHTTDSGFNVAVNIKHNTKTMKVVAYTTRLPWSKVIGYAKDDTIYCNTRKFNLPLKDRVENLFHEACHNLGYAHSGNRVTAYNLNSVPFKTAAIFVRYLESIGKV